MDLTIHNALHDKTLEPVYLGIRDGKIAQVSSTEISPGEKTIDAWLCKAKATLPA